MRFVFSKDDDGRLVAERVYAFKLPSKSVGMGTIDAEYGDTIGTVLMDDGPNLDILYLSQIYQVTTISHDGGFAVYPLGYIEFLDTDEELGAIVEWGQNELLCD